MTKERIIVLGAGLSGLSAAWHLQKLPAECMIFEKEAQAGGLCRSKNLSGFTFDYCGHLLHFRSPYALGLIKNLLKENLLEHKKSAWVYSYNRFTRYPFQANLFGLPRPVIKECLCGFIRAQRTAQNQKGQNHSFLDWIYGTFGKGIARHFMVPYNRKFWTVDPDDLTCDWFEGFIPKPSLKEIISGAVGENKKIFGYNAVFWYPKKGGIQEVPRLLSAQIKHLHLNHEADCLDIRKKEVHFKNGKSYRYDSLVLTLPLPEIARLCRNLPSRVKVAVKNLNYNSILNLNLGISAKGISDKHWVYFPEKKFVFFRAGFPTNFSSALSPNGASSLYTEVSYSKEKPLDKERIVSQAIKGLRSAKIIQPSHKILVQDINEIKYGYIIYDRLRAEAVKSIKGYLEKNRIFTLGRYGSWSYKSMEDCLLDGKQIAGQLSN
ncbi:MAG: FAD-dependent oxidoreductase [Candidatus Omnitrophica bacterium]|nr:FAD-dependent oxidoreductase [Candidatus Omnitrophota bacterium]